MYLSIPPSCRGCKQLTLGEKQGTTWTGHQSITGLTNRDKQPFTLSFFVFSLLSFLQQRTTEVGRGSSSILSRSKTKVLINLICVFFMRLLFIYGTYLCWLRAFVLICVIFLRENQIKRNNHFQEPWFCCWWWTSPKDWKNQEDLTVCVCLSSCSPRPGVQPL